MPSVVLILALDENGKPIGQGSGFYVRPGLVVSNLHVFDRATSASAKDVKSGKMSRVVNVVGIDAINDICAITVDDMTTNPIPIGNSTTVGTGDEVYVASNPKGLEGSLTKGIVSSVRSDIDLIQIDAAISPGSSGGVLLNNQGKAIGIIKSSVVGGQNLNFAIPINKLLSISSEFTSPVTLAGSLAYNGLKRGRLKGPVMKLIEKAKPLDMATGNRTSDEPMMIFEGVFNTVGQSILQTYYDLSKGVFVYKVAKTYSSNGLLERQVTTSRDGKVDDMTLKPSEAIDFAIRTRNFSGTFTDSKGSSTYDSDGNEILTIRPGKKVESVFNSDGLEIQATFYEGAKIEKIRRYAYKYDSYGNWIEKTVSIIFPNTPPLDQKFLIWTGETEYREITYYK